MILDYEVLCYRVMWFDKVFNKWIESDFSAEEFAVSFLNDCIKAKVQCKLLYIQSAVL